MPKKGVTKINKTNCIEKKLGALLPAFELGALSEDKVQQFELHLMECTYCANEVSEFLNYSELLRHDTKLHHELYSTTSTESFTNATLLKLKQLLWPSSPINFHPAHFYIAIVLLFCFSFFTQTEFDNEVRSIQNISLTSMRSTTPKILNKSNGEEGIISFMNRDAIPDKEYQAMIIDENGKTCLEDTYFKYNKSYLGHIFIPLSSLQTGEYHLIINDISEQEIDTKQDFIFYIYP